jgi:hypothetical protein
MNIRIFSHLLCLAITGILVACLATPALAAGSWQVSTVSEDIRDSPFASVAFGPDSVPHVVYHDDHTSSIQHAWGSGGTWNTETIGPSAGTYTTSVPISPDGNPAVSFGDGLYIGNLMFASKNASLWERSIVSRGSMGDAGQHSSLAFDRKGDPRIAYNEGQATLYYASLNRTTGKWKLSLIDDDYAYTHAVGYSPSLKIDAQGNPHVAYILNEPPFELRYATPRDSVNWTVTKLDELHCLYCSFYKYTGVSLALDSRGYPHISYYNPTGFDYGHPAQLRYLSWNGNSWDRETVVTVAEWDLKTSLAIDAQDVPHIAYCDGAENSVNYATRSVPGVWSIETADVGKNLLMPSLALDGADNPGIAYYDRVGTALKFAKRVA